MAQQNSKGKREIDDSDKEHEKKIQCQMQKLKEKTERKETQSFSTKNRNIRLEKKLYSVDQETIQTEKRAETKYPSSGRSTEIETEYRTYGKDETDSDSDEAVDNGADILEGTDNGGYVCLHSNPLNRSACIGSAISESLCLDTSARENTENHLFGKESQHSSKNDTKNGSAMKVNKKAEEKLPKACKHAQELDSYLVFIDIRLCFTTTYFSFETETDFDTDVEQVHQDSPAQKGRNVGSTNREKLERSKSGNTTYTAEEKLMKHVKSKETRDKNIQTTSSKLSTVGTTILYDIFNKRFFAQIFSFEKNPVHHFKFNLVRCSINRPAYVHVYAIGFKGESMLMGAFEDKHIIKHILQTQNLREMYLRDEHFRLATFSLSVFNYELGEIIRLAGSGFYCDADGNVKCFCCGNTYTSRSELSNSHHPDCASRTSEGHFGRSIADHYGEFAPGRLVPSGQNVQEEYRTQVFIDIHIRTSTYRLGGTQQFFQDDALAQEDEPNYSANEFSVRENPTHSRQETPHGANIDVSVLGNCLRNMGIQHENQRCVSSHGHEDVCSLEQANVGEPLNSGRRTIKRDVNNGSSKDLPSLEQAHLEQALNTGRRTIKEDVNRGSSNDTARLVTENAQMSARILCRKCKIKQCNIVLIPCRHLVVCDQCVSNTIECPVCGKKVDEAYVVGD